MRQKREQQQVQRQMRQRPEQQQRVRELVREQELLLFYRKQRGQRQQ